MRAYEGATSAVVIKLLSASPDVFAHKQMSAYNNGGNFDNGKFHRKCNIAINALLDWFAVLKKKEPCIVYVEPEIAKDITQCLAAIGLNAKCNVRLMAFNMQVAYIKVEDNV